MTIGQFINMLEQHNRSAKVNFRVKTGDNKGVMLSTEAECKCSEKEMFISITVPVITQ